MEERRNCPLSQFSHTSSPLMLLTLLLLAIPPAAQAQSEYLMYGGTPGTSNWEVRRTVDNDGDGVFTSPGESVQFAADGTSLVTYIEDLRFEMYAGTASMFGPGGGDVILKMQDLDGDGTAAGPGEVMVFADTRAAHGLSNTSPDGVDFDPNTGVLYVTDDIWAGGATPGSGIASYVDIDGDGLALSLGEMTVLVDGAAIVTVPGIGGAAVTIDVGDFEALMVDSNGVVIAFEQQDLVLYACQDQNGDGDAMDPGEIWNFCNLIDNVAGLEVNADILAGVLLPPRCPSTSGLGWYGSLEGLSVAHGAGQNGADVYWIASTASNSGCNSGAGLVYRGEDLNADGDLNDTGEVILALNGPNNSFLLYSITSLYDLDAHDGGFSVFQGNGPQGPTYSQNTVYWFEDLNGDGDVMDSNEFEMRYFWDPDGCYAVSMGSAPAGAFGGGGGNNAYFEVLGVAGTHSNGAVPAIGFNGVPVLGTPIDITLTNSLPSVTHVLAVGWSNTAWGNISLPWDLSGIGMPGNFLFVALDYQFQSNNLSSGQASWTFNTPNNPNLIGKDVYFQYYIVDQAANARGAVTSDYVHGLIG